MMTRALCLEIVVVVVVVVFFFYFYLLFFFFYKCLLYESIVVQENVRLPKAVLMK